MSTKPTLFHDIDGVLFGVYDEAFQLRPGIKPWLNWAHENFEVVWLTTWEPEKIKTLLSVVFAEKYLKALPVIPVVCAEWKLCGSKAEWLHQMMSQRPELDWYWIDDEISAKELEVNQLPAERCIQVSARGQDALRELRHRVEHGSTSERS
jgi:HAD domain in Swiss Army Knife RNA repair proteins